MKILTVLEGVDQLEFTNKEKLFLERKKEKVKISVILTAYGREKFLHQALDSISSQTLDKSEYEVITITNFDFKYVTSPGMKLSKIIMEGSIGQFLKRGIEQSRGEIIAFLDDDDLWEEGKLKNTLKVFSEISDISYYHNSCSFVDEYGRKMKTSFFKSGQLRKFKNKLIFKNFDKLEIMQMLNYAGNGHLSSITIKKVDFEPVLSNLQKITGATDVFFFWSAIINHKKILLDPLQFTKYRFHSLNTARSQKSLTLNGTHSEEFQTKANEYLRQKNTYEILTHYLNDSSGRASDQMDFLKLSCIDLDLMSSIFSGDRRVSVLRDVLKPLRYWKIIGQPSTILVMGMSIVYVFSPKLAFLIWNTLNSF